MTFAHALSLRARTLHMCAKMFVNIRNTRSRICTHVRYIYTSTPHTLYTHSQHTGARRQLPSENAYMLALAYARIHLCSRNKYGRCCICKFSHSAAAAAPAGSTGRQANHLRSIRTAPNSCVCGLFITLRKHFAVRECVAGVLLRARAVRLLLLATPANHHRRVRSPCAPPHTHTRTLTHIDLPGAWPCRSVEIGARLPWAHTVFL